MGILVSEGFLKTSNIAVSNVYMSFSSGDPIYIFKNGDDYRLISTYAVFSNPEKTPGTNIKENLNVPYSNLEQGVFTILYEALKEIYPNNVDC